MSRSVNARFCDGKWNGKPHAQVGTTWCKMCGRDFPPMPRDRCAYVDYVTNCRCILPTPHDPYHETANGDVFGVGYLTAEEDKFTS